jgi:pantetheine-phosphate adenylyltransferase
MARTTRRSASPAQGARATTSRRASAARSVRKAIYAGSFDPPTNGHLDVIERGVLLFDELIVAVGHNPAKKTLFDLDERLDLLRRNVPAHATVVSFTGLLVDAARAHGAGVILRGVRGTPDFELELRNGLANRDLSGIETLFLLADPAHVFVSSTLVKEIATHGGDVSKYVPESVLAPLMAKLKRT